MALVVARARRGDDHDSLGDRASPVDAASSSALRAPRGWIRGYLIVASVLTALLVPLLAAINLAPISQLTAGQSIAPGPVAA